MLKLALSNKVVNALAKKLIAKFLAKKIGVDGKISINELYAVEQEGRVKLKIDAELDISSDAIGSLIDLI